MQPSVDGRRKTTIQKQKEKERIDFEIKQLERFAKDLENMVGRFR